MSTLTDAIERRLASRAGLYLAVQEDEEVGLVLSGIVGSEELRQAALDIARELAGAVTLVDDIEVLDTIPDEIAEVPADARGAPARVRAPGRRRRRARACRASSRSSREREAERPSGSTPSRALSTSVALAGRSAGTLEHLEDERLDPSFGFVA